MVAERFCEPAPGFNEPAGGMGSRPRRGGPGMSRSSQALPGSLSSSDPMIDKPEARRFPSPWIAEETDACFIIRDHSGYALA